MITMNDKIDLSFEEMSCSIKHFENFLHKNRLCYYRNKGILAKNSRSSFNILYSIFISVGKNIEKFNILFSPQISFMKIRKPPHKYIFAYLSKIESEYSMQEALNTLYCAYSLEEDVMVFKPLIWMLNYYKAIMKKVGSNPVKGTNKVHSIRINPEPKKQKDLEKNQYSSASVIISARSYPEGYGYSIGIQNIVLIYYKDLYIITENEIVNFFNQHNSYPESWKLKFKVATNLLTEGELI